MNTTKRTTNIFGLRFKFIPQTNTTPSRYRVTQTNTNKSTFISSDFGNLTPFEGMTAKLDSIEQIKSFCLIIDNTQTNYYTFAITTDGNEIPNLLPHFKTK